MTSYADEYKNTFTYFSRDIVDVDPHTLEDLQAHLEKFPEITFVSIPHTWFGYGTNFVNLANNEYLEKFHANDIHSFNTELFLERELFFKNDSNSTELQELFFYIQNEYPVIDDEILSRMEYEAKMEFLNDEIRYELELEPEEIEELFQKLEIDYSEWVEIDNDGYTVYALKDDLAELFAMLKEAI